MEILLLQKVEKLGEAGQVLKVTDGYARNFLIPRRLAVPATSGAVEIAKHLSQKRQAELRKILDEAQALRERIESLECKITVKSGREDKLYGSVTNVDIARELQGLGVSIDRKKIVLKEPIKSLGHFKVPVKIHSEVEASLKVSVVRK
jgi:large subunit ribosomal protein L9